MGKIILPFLGQGFHDHLKQDRSNASFDQAEQWKQTDIQLCALLWQSGEPKLLGTLRSFRTCNFFLEKGSKYFANDIQSLYDSAPSGSNTFKQKFSKTCEIFCHGFYMWKRRTLS